MALPEPSTTLDRLVREHIPAVLRFATRLTGDLDSAEDIVQEALLRAARSWKSFRGEAQFKTWLFRIVINVFRDQRGRRVAESIGNREIRDYRPVDPVEHAVANELRERIAQAVSRLPGRQREVLVLITYERFTVDDVAAALGISTSNVRANLFAARERLRQLLSPFLAERQNEGV